MLQMASRTHQILQAQLAKNCEQELPKILSGTRGKLKKKKIKVASGTSKKLRVQKNVSGINCRLCQLKSLVRNTHSKLLFGLKPPDWASG